MFSLQNITDEPVSITSLRIDAQRLAQTSAQVLLGASDMNTLESLPNAPLPVEVAPRAIVTLYFAFDVDTACEPVTDDRRGLDIHWETSDGSGDLTLTLPYDHGSGWVKEVTSHFCG
jgi:hypothetical protein